MCWPYREQSWCHLALAPTQFLSFWRCTVWVRQWDLQTPAACSVGNSTRCFCRGIQHFGQHLDQLSPHWNSNTALSQTGPKDFAVGKMWPHFYQGAGGELFGRGKGTFGGLSGQGRGTLHFSAVYQDHIAILRSTVHKTKEGLITIRADWPVTQHIYIYT